MTNTRLQIILDRYQNILAAQAIYPVKDGGTILQHIQWMILEMRAFTDFEKCQRWLGFIQGVLYCREIFTLEELKAHNQA